MKRLEKDATVSHLRCYVKKKKGHAILHGPASGLCPVFLLGTMIFSVFFLSPQLKSAETEIKPHPAVVRVIAFEAKSPACGSGSLIGQRGNYSYIITNWHVIRDSTGLVVVQFPDKTSAQAVVVAVDSLWDLALLATRASQVTPIRIAANPPKKGDPLWLAGYGSDNTYKIAGGYCTQYTSPTDSGKEKELKELVEFSAVARLGDSGGPIFNQQMELAGVLFGTDNTITLGSYSGRILKFLDEAAPYVLALPQDPNELFRLAKEETRTILQRNDVVNPTVLPAVTPSVSEPTTVYSQSSVSSFGGGGSKKRRSAATPLVDPFQAVQSIQTQFGFQGFKFGKSDGKLDQAPVASPLALASDASSNPSASSAKNPSAPAKTPFSENRSGNNPIAAGNHARGDAVRAATPNGTQTPHTQTTQAAGTQTGSSTTPARLSPGNSSQNNGTPNTGGPGYTPATVSPSYSSNGNTGTSSPSYGDSGASSSGSRGTLPTSPASSLPPTAMSLPPTTTSLPPATTSLPSSHESYRPAPSGTFGKGASGNDNYNYDNPYKTDGRNNSGGYFNDSYSSNDRSRSNSGSYQNDDSTLPYSSGGISSLVEDTATEKYAASFSSDTPENPGKFTRFDAFKIIGAIIVIFFILFHAVKMMSIIEEQ